MLYGLDISNWQKTLNLGNLPAFDFCICKATEGTNFVDPYCDRWVQWLIGHQKLFGFYHFMTDKDPRAQADYFVTNCKGYFKLGIPVLDIESGRIGDRAGYAQTFVDRVHVLTGVYPVIYASAAYLPRFAGTQVPKTCGLWVAGYPTPQRANWDNLPDLPYKIAPWQFAAMWQFTSAGKLAGFGERLDLDVAYMTREQWMKYANPDAKVSDTAQLPKVSSQGKTFHFSNSLFDIDITMKGGKTNEA